ncbi:hypothetical protein B0H19DRAFT_1085094 [Mycena capillaripes]|nr:hypothetical protein B0H19DRAFT_1085094 [Mycena capillaripes]
MADSNKTPTLSVRAAPPPFGGARWPAVTRLPFLTWSSGVRCHPCLRPTMFQREGVELVTSSKGWDFDGIYHNHLTRLVEWLWQIPTDGSAHPATLYYRQDDRSAGSNIIASSVCEGNILQHLANFLDRIGFPGSTSNIKVGDPSPKKHNSIWQFEFLESLWKAAPFSQKEQTKDKQMFVWHGCQSPCNDKSSGRVDGGIKLLMAGLNRDGAHAAGWSQSDAQPTSSHGYQGTHGCQWVKTTSAVQNVDVGNAIHESSSLAQPSAL